MAVIATREPLKRGYYRRGLGHCPHRTWARHLKMAPLPVQPHTNIQLSSIVIRGSNYESGILYCRVLLQLFRGTSCSNNHAAATLLPTKLVKNAREKRRKTSFSLVAVSANTPGASCGFSYRPSPDLPLNSCSLSASQRPCTQRSCIPRRTSRHRGTSRGTGRHSRGSPPSVGTRRQRPFAGG